MPRKRDYRIVDATYLDTAPVRETIRQPIPASASATFRSLEDADAWPVWLIPVEKVTWTSSAPFGVGTTRDIDGRAGTISEYFFDWEDGRRMSFYFSSGQVPLFAAFAEEYDVVPTADDSCELVWRYGFECHGAY
ncbi:MAG: SRPBCC family protein, partial [Acidimicrobiia bacterium]|nr:SRPBCC family protein [Acidimicrobiia bacterium]